VLIFCIPDFASLLDCSSLSNSGALKVANARISSLEAELDAYRTAFDAATAAKVKAKKSAKSALAKAKKAEKDPSNANKEHLQQEQAVAERLNQMSAAAGGTYYNFFAFFQFPCPFFAC
jgi:chromosome segregation ATPase